MKGRTFSDGSRYRYGFNGEEMDEEGMGGGGATYDYGFRIYNPNLGRFLSVDPLSKEYSYNSTYAFAENDVIRSIDLDGLEKLMKIYVEVPYNKQGVVLTNPNGDRVMEITDGHKWTGTHEVKAYFVYDSKTGEYRYYDGDNPGDAEAKMRADGIVVKSIDYKLPSSGKIINDGLINSKDELAVRFKESVSNYFSGFTSVFGYGAVAQLGNLQKLNNAQKLGIYFLSEVGSKLVAARGDLKKVDWFDVVVGTLGKRLGLGVKGNIAKELSAALVDIKVIDGGMRMAFVGKKEDGKVVVDLTFSAFKMMVGEIGKACGATELSKDEMKMLFDQLKTQLNEEIKKDATKNGKK